MKTIFEAPHTSPLIEIDLFDVGRFIIQLTEEDFLKADTKCDEGNPHDEIAFTLCNEIISNPESYHSRTLIRLLLTLRPSFSDSVKIRELKKLQEQMVELVKEKLSLRSLERFGANLNEWIDKNPDIEPANDMRTEEENDPGQESYGVMNDSTSSRQTKRRILFSHSNNALLPNEVRCRISSIIFSYSNDIISSGRKKSPYHKFWFCMKV